LWAKRRQISDYNAKVSAVDNIINGVLSSFQSLGGDECEPFLKTRISPSLLTEII
jgi:hypothetical protein